MKRHVGKHRRPRSVGKNIVLVVFIIISLGGLCYALYPVMPGVVHQIESQRVINNFRHKLD